ncbi:unnamed protein product, partial [Polarella glacialis]
AAAVAAASSAARVAQAKIERGGDSGRSDCLVEVADVDQALPGNLDSSWPVKAKVALQQAFRRFGPVVDVRVPTRDGQSSIRFASPKGAEAAMVAAAQGFLPLGEAEVRLRQPMSSEAIWRSFPAARRFVGDGDSKKKKLRPNERFAPPRMPAPEFIDEEDLRARQAAEAARQKQAQAPPPTTAPPAQHVPPEPARPAPSQVGAEASPEDRQAAAGEVEVAKEMSELLNQPFSKQKKALKKLRLQWHPDKNPDRPEVATRVFQFVQAHDVWLAHHGLG